MLSVGVLAALGAALSFALSSVLFASQAERFDTLSASALRAIGAVSFFAIAVVALGAGADLIRIEAGVALQLVGTGLILFLLGESLYTAAIASIGLTRTFTTVIGLEYLVAFILAALFLGEAVTGQMALGALLVLAGVYLVALYGRRRAAERRPDPVAAGRGPTKLAACSQSTPRRGIIGTVRRHDGMVRGNSGVPDAVAMQPSASNQAMLPFIGRFSPGFWLGFALAVATGLAWGGGIVWLRSAADGLDATAAGAVRLYGGAPLLLLAAVMQRETAFRRREISRRTGILLILSGVLGYGFASLLFIVALGRIGTGPTVVLFSTSPIMGLAVGALFLREPITIWMIAGAVLAVAGVALIV